MKFQKILPILLITVIAASMFSSENSLYFATAQYSDNFDDNIIGSEWNVTLDPGIQAVESNGAVRFSKILDGSPSDWDYGSIVKPISVNTGSIIKTDFRFNFTSVSVKGSGEINFRILNSYKNQSVLLVRLRDYQASSVAYEPRMMAYDSLGTRIFDQNLGYQSSQSGAGSFSVEWKTTDTIQVNVTYPDSPTPWSETIFGVNEDVGYVGLGAGVDLYYSGDHTYAEFESYSEQDVDSVPTVTTTVTTTDVITQTVTDTGTDTVTETVTNTVTETVDNPTNTTTVTETATVIQTTTDPNVTETVTVTAVIPSNNTITETVTETVVPSDFLNQTDGLTTPDVNLPLSLPSVLLGLVGLVVVNYARRLVTPKLGDN